MYPRASYFALCSCLLLVAACAHVAPQPLEPKHSLEAFRQRQLTDPNLLARVQSALPDQEPAPTGTSWNRAELLVAALQLNPGLSEARTQITQAAAAVRTAHALPNPTVNLASEYDVSRAAEPAWLWGVSTSFLLDGFASRHLRTDIADAGLRGARADLGDAIWSLRRDLRAALVGVLISERRIHVLESQTQQRADLLRLAQARVSAGEAARSDALQSELELVRSRSALEDARRAQVEARAKLAGSIGVPPGALDAVVFRWEEFEQLSLPSASQLDAFRERALLSRPDLERAIADYAARELELKQQLRAQYLQFAVGPGYTWDHGIRKVTLGASMSLPIFNRNQGPIAEAVANREAAGKHALAVQARILNEIEAATQTYSSALAALDRAREQHATSEALASAARSALAIDAEDRPTTLSAELAASAEGIAELDALERAQQALGQLEDALRSPLFGPETTLFRGELPTALKESP